MGIALSTTLQTSFDDAVKRTREALAHKGFGVLSEIDVKATLKAKLGEDMEDYLILGACNPQFAHQAVNVYRQIGGAVALQRGGPPRPRGAGYGHRRSDASQIDGRRDQRAQAG